MSRYATRRFSTSTLTTAQLLLPYHAMDPCFCGAPPVVPIARGRWIGGRHSGDKHRYSVCRQRVAITPMMTTNGDSTNTNTVDDNMNTSTNEGGDDNGAAPAGGGGSGNGGNSREVKKKKARPRLTVQADVMARLRKVAVEREMTASELAEELLAQYLEQVPDEDEGGDADGDGNVEEEKVDTTSS